jgi:hypothetical protein
VADQELTNKVKSQSDKDGVDTAHFVMEKPGKIEDIDRSFDIEFWQRQTPGARFDAAWELVVFAHKHKGQDGSELRLQRTIESLERREG